MTVERRAVLLAYAALALVMLLWAGNSIIARAVRDVIPPFTLALLRWSGALALVLPFAWRHVRTEVASIARHWRIVLLLGLLGVAAFNAFLYSGLRHTTASNAMLLQAGIPTLVLVADRIGFGVRPGRARMAGVLLSTAGVVGVVLHGDPFGLADVRFNRGDVLVLCGVVAWALYTSLLRRRPPIHGMSLLAATFLVGVLAMAPLAAGEWQAARAIEWDAAAIGAVIYVAVLPSVVAYMLFNSAVTRLGPAAAGQAITLMPVFGALLAAATLGEVLHGYHFAGMALILLGIVVPLFARRRRSAVAP